MYVGPEVIMPLASALAAIAGFLMIFWRKVVKLFRAAWQLVASRRSES